MRNIIVAIQIILFATGSACATQYSQRAFETVFSSSWSDGIDRRIEYQAANQEAIQIVHTGNRDMPDAIRVQIARTENYDRVENGTPRAELSFAPIVRFVRNREYLIRWQTLIPSDYQIDRAQPEVFAQIHQGRASGFPTFAFFLSSDGHYAIRSRTGNIDDSVVKIFGDPSLDRGRVVNWELHYIPDDTGHHALTEVYKDGVSVLKSAQKPNAYPGDDQSYFKIGLYKANWKKKLSDVQNRILYYGRVVILMRN
jgi:hypothetical protein